MMAVFHFIEQDVAMEVLDSMMDTFHHSALSILPSVDIEMKCSLSQSGTILVSSNKNYPTVSVK